MCELSIKELETKPEAATDPSVCEEAEHWGETGSCLHIKCAEDRARHCVG